MKDAADRLKLETMSDTGELCKLQNCKVILHVQPSQSSVTASAYNRLVSYNYGDADINHNKQSNLTSSHQ